MADDDEPIVLSVAEYFQMDGLESGGFPITVEVRDQLAELLNAYPGPQIDALFKAIMTTVMNLELTSMTRHTELIALRGAAIKGYSELIKLRTELVQNQLIRPTPLPHIEWFPEDD